MMAKKLTLSLLGAGIALGMTIPALAQNYDRHGASQNSKTAYSHDTRHDTRQSQYDRRNNGSWENDRRHHNNSAASKRSVKRLSFNTRHRATIFLTMETFRSRGKLQNVCTVTVRGPQSRLVPKQRLRQIARNNCSRRAQIRINT